MIFYMRKNGEKINLTHISSIKIDNNKLKFYPAKGSLNAIEDEYDTEVEAKEKYEELKKNIID